MREATTPGYFSLLRQRKSNQKERRPDRSPPYGRYPVLLASPGRSRTRRAQTTRFGLDQRSRTPPRESSGARLAQRGPTTTTTATTTTTTNAPSSFVIASEAKQSRLSPRLLRRYAPRNDRQNVKDRDGYTPGSPMARPSRALPRAASPEGDANGFASVASRYRDVPSGNLRSARQRGSGDFAPSGRAFFLVTFFSKAQRKIRRERILSRASPARPRRGE